MNFLKKLFGSGKNPSTGNHEKMKTSRNVEGSIKSPGDKKNETERKKAIKTLSMIGHLYPAKPKRPGLLNDESEEDSAISAALETLGKIGDASAVEPLLSAYGSNEKKRSLDKSFYKNQSMDMDIRSALEAIGEPAVEPLISALKDNDRNVRIMAIRALGAIGDARAVEPIILALEDKDWDVRDSAAAALGRIGDVRAVEPLISTFRANKKSLWERIVPYYEDDGPGYPERNPTPAKALGAIGEPAVAPLISAIKSDDEIGVAAAGALKYIADTRAFESLISALKDEKYLVRGAAAEALGNIGDARAAELLISALEDESSYVRAGAAGALGKIGDARAVEPLISALQDKESYVRITAAEALGKIGDARAIEPLELVSKNDNRSVRSYADMALKKLKTK